MKHSQGMHNHPDCNSVNRTSVGRNVAKRTLRHSLVRTFRYRSLTVENLEERRVLAASVGWDGPGQGSAALTYYIGQAPSSLDQAVATSAIQTALKAWSDVANIQFTPTTQAGLNNSIDFTFKPIDGAGGTLAQAYFPSDVNRGRIAGDVQFDSAERWEVGNKLGNAAFDLVLVAVHEIGHALGLDHSSIASSVMYPSVSASQTFTGLNAVDVSAIQRLYAATSPSAGTQLAGVPRAETTDSANSETNPTPAPESPAADAPRTSRWTRWGQTSAGAVPRHNSNNALDVNDDSQLTPTDALLVINLLRKPDASLSLNFKYDTNADGNVSPVDALLVINGLRTRTMITISIGTEDTTSQSTTISIDPSAPNEETTNVTITFGNTTNDLPNNDVADSASDTSETDDSITPDEHDGMLDGAAVANRRGPRNESSSWSGLHGLPSIEQVDRYFSRFDSNTDGSLSAEEVPSRTWNRLIERGIDTDENALISNEEMLAFVATRQQHWFDRRDTDEDGLLQESELPRRLWSKLSEAGADVNADGGISLAELLAYQANSSTTGSEEHPTVNTETTRPSMTIRISIPGFGATVDTGGRLFAIAQSMRQRFWR